MSAGDIPINSVWRENDSRCLIVIELRQFRAVVRSCDELGNLNVPYEYRRKIDFNRFDQFQLVRGGM